ncbi:hypothetical protein HK105_200539 [Polyrhizophydium stewartii]|uniref:Lebercilin domain-containing protein n=1 Tax=Polyrhizophydium stewartii TaxID=2732419 RepID=A0ABR4NJB2_9FUNG
MPHLVALAAALAGLAAAAAQPPQPARLLAVVGPGGAIEADGGGLVLRGLDSLTLCMSLPLARLCATPGCTDAAAAPGLLAAFTSVQLVAEKHAGVAEIDVLAAVRSSPDSPACRADLDRDMCQLAGLLVAGEPVCTPARLAAALSSSSQGPHSAFRGSLVSDRAWYKSSLLASDVWDQDRLDSTAASVLSQLGLSSLDFLPVSRVALSITPESPSGTSQATTEWQIELLPRTRTVLLQPRLASNPEWEAELLIMDTSRRVVKVTSLPSADLGSVAASPLTDSLTAQDATHVTDIAVSGSISMMGFHGDILLDVRRSADLCAPGDTSARVLIVQPLSSDAFADPFQIGRIEYEEPTRVEVFGSPDLEAPESSADARDNVVVISTELSCGQKTQISVPVHLRYQAAQWNAATHTNVTLQPPAAFIIVVPSSNDGEPKLLRVPHRFESLLAAILPKSSISGRAELRPIQVAGMERPLVFQVPIGNLGDYQFVVVANPGGTDHAISADPVSVAKLSAARYPDDHRSGSPPPSGYPAQPYLGAESKLPSKIKQRVNPAPSTLPQIHKPPALASKPAASGAAPPQATSIQRPPGVKSMADTLQRQSSRTSLGKAKKSTPPKSTPPNIDDGLCTAGRSTKRNKKPAIDFAHMASASLEEIARLVQTIDEQKAQIAQLLDEQRTLKIAEKSKYHERILALEKTGQAQTEEIYRLQEKIHVLNVKLKQSEMADVAEMRQQLERQAHELSESTLLITQLQKQVRQLESERDREISFAKTRNGKLMHELDLAKTEIESLKQRMREKDRHINALSIYTAPHPVRSEHDSEGLDTDARSVRSSKHGASSVRQRGKGLRRITPQPHVSNMSPVPSVNTEIENAPIVLVSLAGDRDRSAAAAPASAVDDGSAASAQLAPLSLNAVHSRAASTDTQSTFSYARSGQAVGPGVARETVPAAHTPANAAPAAGPATLPLGPPSAPQPVPKSTIHKPAMFITKPHPQTDHLSPKAPPISPPSGPSAAASAAGQYEYDLPFATGTPIETLLAQRVEGQLDNARSKRAPTTTTQYSDDFA